METSKYDSYKILSKFSDELSNIISYNDALLIYKLYATKTTDKVEKILMKSLLNDNKYKKRLSKEEFEKELDIIRNIRFKEIDNNTINNIYSKTNDIAQIETIKRIINSKPTEPNIVSLSKLRNDNKLHKKETKNCPHCGKGRFDKTTANYVICGYNKKGYDWKGCGFDWCFKCNKKLCKCWSINHLYNIKNRYHNNKCCKSHAIKTGSVYSEEYCQCKNNHVHR